MWAAIGAIIQLVFLILKTKFEKDAEERKRRDELLVGWKEVIKSGDKSKVTAMLDTINSGVRK